MDSDRDNAQLSDDFDGVVAPKVDRGGDEGQLATLDPGAWQGKMGA